MNTVVTHESLQSFFNQSIQHALKKQCVEASDHTVVYLSGLLENFAFSENLFEVTSEGLQLKPLALYYADAVSAETRLRRTQALRKLGDVALFISAVFTDSLARKPIDVDYYVAMGGSAYSCLYSEFGQHTSNTGFAEVYFELSRKFVQFMDVLAGIYDRARYEDANYLRQYDIWRKTGSQVARQRLVEAGFDPDTFIQTTLCH